MLTFLFKYITVYNICIIYITKLESDRFYLEKGKNYGNKTRDVVTLFMSLFSYECCHCANYLNFINIILMY